MCQLPLAACTPDRAGLVPYWTAELGIWVLVHLDLRAGPRVSRVFEHLSERLAAYVRSG